MGDKCRHWVTWEGGGRESQRGRVEKGGGRDLVREGGWRRVEGGRVRCEGGWRKVEGCRGDGAVAAMTTTVH